MSAFLLLTGCTSTPPQAPKQAEVIHDYQLGPLGNCADKLLGAIETNLPCINGAGPADQLQSPVKVGEITCSDVNSVVGIFTYNDVAGIHYQVSSTQIGTGVSRGFVIGDDWLITVHRSY